MPVADGDPLIAAAGDIACDLLLLAQPLDAVLALGDNQYDCGGYQAFLQSYDPSWGA